MKKHCFFPFFLSFFIKISTLRPFRAFQFDDTFSFYKKSRFAHKNMRNKPVNIIKKAKNLF